MLFVTWLSFSASPPSSRRCSAASSRSYQDKLHLILGFSAGAVLGVALFDLLPEAFDLAGPHYSTPTVTLFVAIGFFAFLFLNRVLLLHPEDEAMSPHGHHRQGHVGAASLSLHSFLDGVGIGLAFKVSTTVGVVVAAAVLAHDFSDGINTVTVILKNRGKGIRALKWLLVDAIAPLLGVISTYFFTLSDAAARHPALALLRLLPLHRGE